MVQVFLSQMIYWQICPQRRCCPDTNNTMSALVSLLSWQPRYYLFLKNIIAWGSPAGSDVKESACNVGAWVRSLGQEDLMEKGRATHSSILAWRIAWTEEPGRLPSIGLQRIRCYWSVVAWAIMYIFCSCIYFISLVKTYFEFIVGILSGLFSLACH